MQYIFVGLFLFLQFLDISLISGRSQQYSTVSIEAAGMGIALASMVVTYKLEEFDEKPTFETTTSVISVKNSKMMIEAIMKCVCINSFTHLISTSHLKNCYSNVTRVTYSSHLSLAETLRLIL